MIISIDYDLEIELFDAYEPRSLHTRNFNHEAHGYKSADQLSV